MDYISIHNTIIGYFKINVIFQLPVKLAELPKYTFVRKPPSVCVRPELSDVTEMGESEYSLNSTASTLKLRPVGYCHRKRYTNVNKNSQSDSELARNLDTVQEETIKHSRIPKSLQSNVEKVIYNSDELKDDRVNNSLFVATIGSADESVIKATLEKLPKNKDINTDNLIELLVQEAFQAKDKEAELSHRGTTTSDGNKQELEEYSEAIEKPPFADPNKTLKRKQKSRTVVSKSTSDESNTEAINDTPMVYVNVRKRNLKKSAVIDEEILVAPQCESYGVQAIDDFFTQHFAKSKTEHFNISPTLAKKINVSSSETSEDFDQCLANVNMNMNCEEFQDAGIIECLNSMIDKVCNEFEKCTEYLEREVDNNEILNLDGRMKENENYLEQCKTVEERELTNKSQTNGKGKIKLRYSVKKRKPMKAAKNKLPLELVPKMSTIVEVNVETDVSVIKNNTENKDDKTDNKNNIDKSLIRRKRKLYSPKDDIISIKDKESKRQENQDDEFSKSDDDVVLADFKKDKTNTAMCYRELEKERQKNKITTRRARREIDALSPKSKKNNDVFDNLKETIESEQKIKLADKKSVDVAIYNYTSESEDEDFKQKKIELQKRTSTTTVASGNSIVSTRRGRAVNKVNYTEDGKEYSTDANKKPKTKRRNVTKRNTRSKNILKEELIDERMRDPAPQTLETSFIVEKQNSKDENLIPVINPHETETIPENDHYSVIAESDGDKQIKKTKRTRLAVKKQQLIENAKAEVKLTSDKEDERTLSPLPGLLVETVKDKSNLDDSLPSHMVQKFKRVYHEGPDACNEVNVTNTTQNLLSDNDRVMNITEEFKIEEEISKADISGKYSKMSQDLIISPNLPITDVENRQNTDQSGSSKKTKRSLRLKSRIPSVIDNSVQEDNVEKSRSKTKMMKLRTKATMSKMEYQKKSIETIHSNERNKGSTTNSKELQQQFERISISDDTDMKSEKSIATAQITAHGDFNELPPSSSSLGVRHLPREIADMDASLKEFCVKLHHEAYLGNSNSSRFKDNFGRRNKTCDDISVNTSTPQEDEIQSQKSETRSRYRENSPSEVKSVSVSIPRMSPDEMSKWLPTRQNLSTDHEDPVPDLCYDDIRKCLPSPRSSDTEGSKRTSPTIPFRRTTKSVERKIASSQDTKRISTISPIRFFDECLPTFNKYDTKNTTKTEASTTVNTNSTVRKLNTNVRMVSKEVQQSTSTLKESKSPEKRKAVVTLELDAKKRKMNMKEDAEVSSGTSVDDWFRMNAFGQGN